MSQQGVDNIEQGIVGKPRNLLELASALSTSPEWLLYAEGAEEVRRADPMAELIAQAKNLPADKLNALLAYSKRLQEANEAA